MMKSFIICGLLLSAPLAILGLKCYSSNQDGTATLTECLSSDQVCAIVKGKLINISLDFISTLRALAIRVQLTAKKWHIFYGHWTLAMIYPYKTDSSKIKGH